MENNLFENLSKELEFEEINEIKPIDSLKFPDGKMFVKNSDGTVKCLD